MRGISSVAEDLSASHEGLCSMELVRKKYILNYIHTIAKD
jgi:hypothetical protein